eukprot:s495_g13.t1
MRETHQMGHGDSFQVFVQMRNPEQSASHTAPTDHVSSGASSSHQAPDHTSATASQSSTVNLASDNWDMHHFMTTMHVFPLDGEAVVITLVNDQDIAPSQTIAHALGVSLQDLEALHQIPIRPDDIPREDIAVVAQCTGNIEVGEDCRLLLIDIFYHNHPDGQGHSTRPLQVRYVKCTATQILRDSLFTAASVYQYCTLITQDCTVELDGIPWPADDWNPRRVHHGSYARVDVPPPQGYDLPTHQAASTLEADAVHGLDTIAALSEDEDPEPPTSLLQQSAVVQSTSVQGNPGSQEQDQRLQPSNAVSEVLAQPDQTVVSNDTPVHDPPAAARDVVKPPVELHANGLCSIQEVTPMTRGICPASVTHQIPRALEPFASPHVQNLQHGDEPSPEPPVQCPPTQGEGPLSTMAVLNPLQQKQSPDPTTALSTAKVLPNQARFRKPSKPQKNAEKISKNRPEHDGGHDQPDSAQACHARAGQTQSTLLRFIRPDPVVSPVHDALCESATIGDNRQQPSPEDLIHSNTETSDAVTKPAVSQTHTKACQTTARNSSRKRQTKPKDSSGRLTLHAFFGANAERQQEPDMPVATSANFPQSGSQACTMPQPPKCHVGHHPKTSDDTGILPTSSTRGKQGEGPLSSVAVLNPLPPSLTITPSVEAKGFTSRHKGSIPTSRKHSRSSLNQQPRQTHNQEPNQCMLHAFFCKSNASETGRKVQTDDQTDQENVAPDATSASLLVPMDKPADATEHEPTKVMDATSSAGCQPCKARCSASQQQDPPRFSQRIPHTLPPAIPQQGGNTMWRLDLQCSFEDLAQVEHATTGPVMYVQVWYVDHARHPSCRAPRIVRLDDIPELWFEDLCRPWMDQISLLTPLFVWIVHPTPPYTFQEHAKIHLILEQNQSPQKVSLLFTAAFHGGVRLGLYQVAESAPRQISRQMMIDKHGFQSFCAHSPCKMFSGREEFQHVVPEEVHSGISLLLDIGYEPHARQDDAHRPGSSTDATSLLQTRMFQRIAPRSNLKPVSVRSPAAFTKAIQWQTAYGFDQTGYVQSRPVVSVTTWFVDASCPQVSHDHRSVQLGSHPSQWVTDVLRTWQDAISHHGTLELHVATPDPWYDTNSCPSNVIIVQNPQQHQKAVLLPDVTTQTPEGTYSYKCVMVPPTVTSAMLLASNEGTGKKEIVDIQVCHGELILSHDVAFPVRNGWVFEFQQPWSQQTRQALAESADLIRMQIHSIAQTIRRLQGQVTAAMRYVPSFRPSNDSPVGSDPQHSHTAVKQAAGPHLGTHAHEVAAQQIFVDELQAFCTPLSKLGPAVRAATAPVITWFVDHVRFPQCFAARLVQLYDNPQEWTELIKRAWHDAILPQHEVHFHLVTPAPEQMEVYAAAHVLVVQQPVPGFRTVLVTTFDSAIPGTNRRHASMCPQEMTRFFLLGLAFLDQECTHPHNTCSAWVGAHEIEQDEVIGVPNGQSLTVAIHRHIADADVPPDVWEHADEVQGPHRVEINLQATLPEPRHDLTSQIHDEFPQMLWFENPAWMLELQNQPVRHTLCMSMVPPIAWAVIATAKTIEEDEVFLGCAYGSVQIQPSHPEWIGADTMDNIASELSALAIAQLIALRWPGNPCLCIRPDLALSRLLAEAVTTCRSNKVLAQICKNLGVWLARRVVVHEVRGHTQHPWNELADTVAKWALTTGTSSEHLHLQALHDFAGCPRDVGWTWMQTTHPSMMACFPPLVEQQIVQITASNAQVPSMATERSGFSRSQVHHTQWELHCKTANVLATEVWAQQAVGSKRTGQRTLRLDQQWHKAGAQVVGVQEARTAAGQYESPHYRILASGAKIARAPLYGCELWIHRTLPLAKDAQGSPITLGDAKLIVQHADPRRLFVQAQLETVSFSFIVLHTPCLDKPQQGQPPPLQQLSNWWDETSALITSFMPATYSWVFIDANSPLDAGDGTLFGRAGAETLTKQGELFKSFLQRHDLAVPSTFDTIQNGSTTTWTHSSGNKSRKDYILLPKDMLPTADTAWVDADHDTTFAHEDHLPAALICKGWSVFNRVPEVRRWDEKALLDPQRCQAFRQALSSLPLPSWEVGIDSHSAIFEQQLLVLAQQFFAQKPVRQRKITLQRDTLEAISFKRHVLDFGRKTNAMTQTCFKSELKEIEKTVHALVRRDVQQYYADLIQQLEAAGEMANHRLVYRLLQQLGRKKGAKPPGPKPLPVLKRDDGTSATSFEEQQMIWLKQFSDIEAGLSVEWSDLCIRNAAEDPDKILDVDPMSYPTAWEIQELLSRLKRDKVPGPNLIPPAVMKAGGEVLSRQLAVLYAKSISHAKEPLLWKGGILVPLWKGKASPALPSAYRSIFISNYTTKIFHQCIRQHLVRVWEAGLGTMQYGGRAGMGADIAHHVVQCHQEWAKYKGCPSAILFIDIRSAFYTVLRQSFTSLPGDNGPFCNAMTKLGLKMEDIASLIHAAESDAVAEGLCTHLQHVLQDMMTNTYFSLPGMAEMCHTTRGTRPGDPVADILFNLCMTVLLRDFHEQVQQTRGPVWAGAGTPVQDFSSVTPMPAAAYADVTFVDDAAILMHAKTNEEIMTMVQCIVQAFVHASSRRGLDVNFDKGKTELLWNIVGRGARSVKIDIHQSKDLFSWQNGDQTFQLHVCHEYKHLGTWLQTKHRHAREIAMRGSAAKQQWGQLARSFFTRKLSTEVKSKVFQSLIVSKMVYNAHTWTGISSKDLDGWTNHLRAPIATMLKGKLSQDAKFLHSTDDLFAFCGLLPLREQVYANRLRFLARLLQVCPPLTWSLLNDTPETHSWVGLCREACVWMKRHYPGCLPSADAPFSDWVMHVRLDHQWKGKIKKAVRSAISYHQASATHQVWHKHFEERLKKNGAILPSEEGAQCRKELWQCDLCSKVFGSTQALAMHAHREHGYKKKVRYFTAGETCPVCLQMFHTRKRLSIHLEKTERCYSVVQACWPPMPASDVQALDDIDKEVESRLRKEGWWASKAFQPVMQTAGPALPPVDHQGSREMFAKMQARRPSDSEAFSQLQGRQVQQVTDQTKELWWRQSDLPAFVMQSVEGPDHGNGVYSMSGLAKEAAMLHIRALVVVHFFSGFRRQGDIHDVIDHFVAATGAHIFTISVDLCMQRQHADLATDGALKWWADRAASGQLASIGGGPPCETYTAARYQQLVDGKGPRPLRSSSEPQGLPALTRKERMQIWIGDALLRFLIDMLAIMAAMGLSGFLEHPQYPVWSARFSPASIWQMMSIRLMKGLNCFTVVSFDQCVCGALGKKPTTLLLLRLPRVRSDLLLMGDQGRCPHLPGEHAALIGRQEDGSFCTAKAKVYPPGLNLVLGRAMFAFAQSIAAPTQATELPSVFQPYTEQAFADDSTVQPDYHGRFCINGRDVSSEGPISRDALNDVIRDAVVRGGGDTWKARDFMNAYEDTNLHKAMYRRIQVPTDGFLQIVPNTGCHFHAYEFYNGVEFSRDYKFGNNNKLEPYEDEVSTALNRCLRHHAGKVMFNPRYGLMCDDAGWVDIDDLLRYETVWKQDKTRGHDKGRWNKDEVLYRFQTLFRIMFHSARYGHRVREQILAFGIGPDIDRTGETFRASGLDPNIEIPEEGLLLYPVAVRQVVTNKDIPFSKIRGAWVQDYQQRWIRLIVPSGEEQVVRSGYRSMRTATKASVIRLATQCANAAEQPYDEDTTEVFTILSRFEQYMIPEGGREQYEARQKLTDFIVERKQVTESG